MECPIVLFLGSDNFKRISEASGILTKLSGECHDDGLFHHATLEIEALGDACGVKEE